jgi:hypothetical protein
LLFIAGYLLFLSLLTHLSFKPQLTYFMKGIFLSIIFLCCLQMAVTAQQASVRKPDDVFRISLLARYPDATDEQWSASYDGMSVSFKSGDVYIESIFNKNAQWVCTFTPIVFEALP